MLKQLFCKHNYRLLECVQDFDYCKDFVTFADVGMWYRCKYICRKCGKNKVRYINHKTFLKRKGTDKVFATLYKDSIEKAMKDER